MQMKLVGTVSVNFHNMSTTGHCICHNTWGKKNGTTLREFISSLWISRKPVFQLGERSGIAFSVNLVSP